MSKFCIELEGIAMPDAIAAVVEAWYDAQNTLIISKPDSASDVRIADLVPQKSDGTQLSKWQLNSGLSRSTMYEMLKILGIKPEGRRENGTRVLVSYLSADQVQLLEFWSAAYKNNSTMPQIREALSKAQSFMHLK